jgi:hypothetical protein
VAELTPIVAAGGHPSTPFVVGEDEDGKENDREDTEEDFHGVFRIAWVGVE